MSTPFLKSMSGKFVSRTVLITLAVALVISGLAIASLRSLSSTANTAVANAQATLSADAVAPLEGLANDISSASSTLMLILIVVMVVGVAAAGALALVFSRKVMAPIVGLRNAVMNSADVLPAIVEASVSGDDEVPELPTIVLQSGDEVEALAHSINQVQHTAAELAVTQARMRHENAEQFVDLGQRSQKLLTRQMHFIEQMEKDETNPANLKRLFQIDHLATRMRRNAKSVVVLAGKEGSRQLNRPVSVHQLVQAASGEIEHFDRIAIANITGASIDGAVATDLAHLLAELLDNATSQSAPESQTTVGGRPTEHGYLIEIVDHGTGMDAEAMEAANARFATAGQVATEQDPSRGHTSLGHSSLGHSSLGHTSSGHTSLGHTSLGHTVVARLAKRHGVGVRLAATATGGVTARLHLPTSALASPDQTSPAHISAAPPAAVPSAPTAPEPPRNPVSEAPQHIYPDPPQQSHATDPVATAPEAPTPPAQAAFSTTVEPAGAFDEAARLVEQEFTDSAAPSDFVYPESPSSFDSVELPDMVESAIDFGSFEAAEATETTRGLADRTVPDSLESAIDFEVPDSLESAIDFEVPDSLESAIDFEVPDTSAIDFNSLEAADTPDTTPETREIAPDTAEVERPNKVEAAETVDPDPKPSTEAPESSASSSNEFDYEWGELTPNQRQAIEWAKDQGAKTSPARASDVRPGPIDAAELAKMRAAESEISR